MFTPDMFKKINWMFHSEILYT